MATLLTQKHRLFSYNPVFSLYNSKKRELFKTRRHLLKELTSISPRLEILATHLIERKLNICSYPPLGEMMPWVLGELAHLDHRPIESVARGWLPIYLYGLLIDDRADQGQALSSEEQLLVWLLFQIGLRELHKIVNGTPYEQTFDSELSNAVRYQLVDIRESAFSESEEREQYSIGKNSCLVACAAAVAATTESLSVDIVKFTRTLRLALQFLDDLGDWKEDAASNNHTVFLTKIIASFSESSSVRLSSLEPSQILRLAIESNALSDTLRRIQDVLREGTVKK
jgi:hypothetical protein